MNTSTPTIAKADSLKWLVAALLVGGSLVGFYYFAEHSLLLRVIALLVTFGVATAIAAQTEKGRDTLNFIRESQFEVRKVVWPTRQETLQMTGIVVFMVVLVALIIWILDGALFWIVRLLTGQGG
ncbi:MAG: preprotein translocase subunit SecE [Beggiatoa sp. IS2]|nr:MAG: preprotein translocase subunit SecE [Beggiatoa sp. IS2]